MKINVFGLVNMSMRWFFFLVVPHTSLGRGFLLCSVIHQWNSDSLGLRYLDGVEVELTILIHPLAGDLVQIAPPLFPGNLHLVQTCGRIIQSSSEELVVVQHRVD